MSNNRIELWVIPILLVTVGCSATCEVEIIQVVRDKYVNTTLATPSGHRKIIGGDYGKKGDRFLIRLDSFDAYMCDVEVVRGY